MGFWGSLGKIAGNIGGSFIGDPQLGDQIAGVAGLVKGQGGQGDGGDQGIVSQIAGSVGPTLTGLAVGKQKGREAQNAAAADAATFGLRESGQHEVGLENRADIDLKRREFGMTSQSDAYKKALLSALAMNMQDVGIGGVPAGIPVINFTGGARPSALGPQGRAAAAEMNKLAMMKLMNGEQFDPMPDLERTAAPVFQKPGKLENILGYAGTVANGINGANATAQQTAFQKRLADAIAALTAPRTAAAVPALPEPQGVPQTLPGQAMPLPDVLFGGR